MRHEPELTKMTPKQLANLGAGHIAYLREITGAEMAKAFPGTPPIEPDRKVWALFGADGTPLLVSDDAGSALSAAFQNELAPVSVH